MMKKLFCIMLLLCLCTVLTGCENGETTGNALTVESHTWTFENMISSDMMSGSGLCNPDLAEDYPDFIPMQVVLNQSPDNPLQFEMVMGDTDIDRYAWEFTPVESDDKTAVYTVTDTGDGDGNDSPQTYEAVVSTIDIAGKRCYTLVVETGYGILTFTAPMD